MSIGFVPILRPLPPPGVLIRLGSLMFFLIFLLVVIFELVSVLCFWVVADGNVQYGQ